MLLCFTQMTNPRLIIFRGTLFACSTESFFCSCGHTVQRWMWDCAWKYALQGVHAVPKALVVLAAWPGECWYQVKALRFLLDDWRQPARSSCQNTHAQRNMHSKTSRCLCMNERSVCHLHTHSCHINSVCCHRSAEADDLNWVSPMWVLCKWLPEGALSLNC